jgi:hypothetical protein
MKIVLAAIVLALSVMARPLPAFAWNAQWCAGGQDGHPTPAGNAFCAGIFPQPNLGAVAPAAPTAAPSQTQQQQQTQTQTANGGNASVVNNSGGMYGFVPAYAPAPLAGCGDGASLNAALGISRSSGFLPYSTTSFQVGASVPIGRRSRYCDQPAPVAPVTNNYNYISVPAAAAAVAPLAAPAIVAGPTVTKVIYRGRCVIDPREANDLALVHTLRHQLRTNHPSNELVSAHERLERACVPSLRILKELDN